MNNTAYWLNGNDGWFNFYYCSECGHKEPKEMKKNPMKTCVCGRSMLNTTAGGIVEKDHELDDFARECVS